MLPLAKACPGVYGHDPVSASLLVLSTLAEAERLSGQSMAPAGLSVLQDAALSDDGTW